MSKQAVSNEQASRQQGGVTPHKQSQLCCVDTHRQPLAGKDSVADTKTLAETERSQLHPLSPEGKGAWGKRWSPL